MKKQLLSICGAAVVASLFTVNAFAADSTASGAAAMPTAPQAASAGKPDMSVVGYAIGYNLGSSLNKQGIDIPAAAISKGLTAGASGQKSEYSEQELQQTMMQFQQYIMAQRAGQSAQPAMPPAQPNAAAK